MVIKDRIYGEIKVKEKVIEKLILSKPLQRLKKISQDGASHFIQPIRNVNRFEHSVGVWYLSYLFKRPIEEQIACLLHDVPHTAFSHVIDFVFVNEKHEFHEKFTEKLILESEIPNILKKYNIDLEKVLDTSDFELLENDLPDISFDRWDYFMRDGFMMKLLPQILVDEYLSKIKLKKNKLYFSDINLASSFAVLFLNFSRLIWLDPSSHGSYNLLSNVLKKAHDKKIITMDDFFKDDETLMNKIKKSGDKKIKLLLNRLQKGREFAYAEKESAEFYGPNKPRCVDPLVLNDKKIVRLSTIIPGFDNYLEEFKLRYKRIGVIQQKL